MNLLINIQDYDEEEIKRAEARELKCPKVTEDCYKNGYHPSRWELGQVFLNGIWKPFKLNSILTYKKRERLKLETNTVCPDATLLEEGTENQVSLYDKFDNMPCDRPMYADCYIVYMKEIHPADEWYIGGDKISLCYKQPTTMQQRLEIVKALKEYAPFVTIPFLVDLMDNNFNKVYDAVPERLFILENKQFKYVGGPGPFGFVPEEVREYLTKRFKPEQTRQSLKPET
ncbi:hypothetical protein DICPUDRAFT_43625 [Dictyostelium purpureum]|uniref:Iodothyronine deiodinase n=1 Tax=Dictyostelium purpureum TaxID=5786 RepID=F1A4H2_DICPU|nr:uncharacterized protein DICPUDRAFT_43625 [Dictyostelium purpureum]EGC28911.1 hypothetical protein DICPUDRAFT_43625 [Dictyostelium purpureum]|eukprot:XP_003294566.1 hypothetical protein DICPUDRAFT_43625 [Dictyostelium purpureum]